MAIQMGAADAQKVGATVMAPARHGGASTDSSICFELWKSDKERYLDEVGVFEGS